MILCSLLQDNHSCLDHVPRTTVKLCYNFIHVEKRVLPVSRTLYQFDYRTDRLEMWWFPLHAGWVFIRACHKIYSYELTLAYWTPFLFLSFWAQILPALEITTLLFGRPYWSSLLNCTWVEFTQRFSGKFWGRNNNGSFRKGHSFSLFSLCALQNKNPKLKKELSKILPTKWSGKLDHNSEPLNGLIFGTLKFKEFFTRLEQGD